MSTYIDTELLDAIDGLLKKTGMAASVFGRKVLNDGNLVAELRSGRELRRQTRVKVMVAVKVMDDLVGAK